MSLVNPPEENNEPTDVSPIVAHCNNCGQDYYLMAGANQDQSQLLADTVCNCGNSQIVAKATTEGITHVEPKEDVATD